MQKTFKRFLSVALTLAMVFAMIPHMDHATVTASCEHNWVDSVCTLCHEECAHETWYDATCKAPRTCAACGKTEGVALDHTLDENKHCAGCDTTFLAYLDFEGVTFKEDGTTLTDGSVISGTNTDESVSFAKVETKNGGSMLHMASLKNTNTAFTWSYDITDTPSITMSYNVAVTGSGLISNLPVFSHSASPSPIQFGARLGYLQWNGGSWGQVTVGADDNQKNFPVGSTPRWYTVKMVYTYTSDSEYTVKLYIDGELTNCDTKATSGAFRSVAFITAQIGASRVGDIYIDNVRATAGDGEHVAAVPTVCLCAEPSWVDGVCSVCQAHCAHQWEDATCFEPRNCQLCNMEVGEPLDHNYVDGECTLCGDECDHSAGWTEDYVCKGCDYPCPHTTWTEANCTNPKTCDLCGKTEGDKNGIHMLGDDNVCDVCGFGYLADFDFEDGVVPGVASTNDGANTYVQVEDRNGNKVLVLYRAKGVGPAYWYYDLVGTYDNVTLTYNIAMSSSVIRYALFPTVDNSSTTTATSHGVFTFGQYGQTTIQYNKSGWNNITTDEAASMEAASNQWYTVKVVYSNDGDSENDAVYINDLKTNVAVRNYADVGIISILMPSHASFDLKFYVDNICVTTGGDHEPAVPSCFNEHTFDQQVTTDKYIASAASCYAAATYYYSCTCGAKGEETFTIGDALGHSWEDGVCTRCDLPCEHIWENSVCTICKLGCKHENYTPADCDSPWTCNICGKTEGDVSHSWVDADCDTPKTCSICGETEGEPNGHTWVDGKCSVCEIPCTHEKYDANHECEVCGHKCAHETWIPANCTNPKTCAACGKEEGEPSNNHHVLGTDMICDYCDTEFLAYLDFEDVTFVEGSSTTLTDGSVVSGANGSTAFAQVNPLDEGSVLYLATIAGSTSNLSWNYNLGSTRKDITLSYNVAVTGNSSSIFCLPVFSSGATPSNFVLGTRLNSYLMYQKIYNNNAGSWVQLTTGEENSLTTFPFDSTPRWHTVEIKVSITSKEVYTLEVYLDGELTNCTTIANPNTYLQYIAVNLNSNRSNGMYIDNIRATAGDVDHIAAVPTVCLCESPSWSNGVCSVCQAHCEHNWVAADCDEAKHCSRCDKTDGSPLGHDLKNGYCTVCGEPCNHPTWDNNHVCEDCGLKCEHENWDPATCLAPKTCSTCGATEGLKGDHKVTGGKGNCDYCGTPFLAFLDFEDANGDVGNLSAKESDNRYVGIEGGLLHLAAGKTGTANINWNYPITSSASVTVTYNIASTGSGLISNFPVFSHSTGPSPIQFGARQGHIQWNSGSWAPVTVGESETEISWDFNTPRWHTVRMVYTYTSETEYTVKLYVDDVLTNCTVKATTGAFRAVTYITAQIGAAYVGDIYIDNVRVTAGDDANNLPAVPTVPLCPDNSCVVGDDGVCSVCHAVIGNYTHAVPGVNVALGDTLDMNFFIDPTTDLDIGNTYYAKIVQTLEDGTELTKIVPQDEWVLHPTYNKYCVTYGVAAKEMGDTLTVTIHGSKGDVVSPVYTDTIKDYIVRMQQNNAHNEYLVTLGDDLLMYGAAAQYTFGYNTDNPVSNSRPTISDEEIHNTPRDEFDSVEWAGTSLVLESNILLKVFFNADAIKDGYTYRVTYINHNDMLKNQNVTTLTGDKFTEQNGYLYVPVTGLSIADYQTVVTVEILEGDTVLHTVTDNIESFVSRSIASGKGNDIYRAIIQLGKSAYANFHNNVATGYEDVASWAW